MSQSRARVQRQVRQRDRFLCQYPRCRTGGQQYAHIIPESEGGAYDLSNLILLCYEHHNYWQEPARAAKEVRANLIALSTRLRDQAKSDGLLARVFEFPATKDARFDLGGGISFRNHQIILGSPPDHLKEPYLKLAVDGVGLMVINARFEDEYGREIMKIEDNMMTVDTYNAWDLLLERRRFSFQNNSEEIELNLSQEPTGAVRLTGRLYLNGGLYKITDSEVVDLKTRNRMRGNVSLNRATGAIFSPGMMSF